MVFTLGQGLWEFTFMPFRLCNSPVTFKRVKEKILHSIPPSICMVYLDNILLHTANSNNAFANLRQVLQQIASANLHLNPEKCHLFHHELIFLKHEQKNYPEIKYVL
ncbi:hypothetical protein AAFF_G00160980 [Aldrovandia affinis]|uniref:ribonuclease H n=1 Tax=Aldrovandia affinis TaxID=143900 RepID=A0AAD7W8Q6_9TELE|nr:hypothetical protein AAFF_G00160980 [Aldrovandia affinis]